MNKCICLKEKKKKKQPQKVYEIAKQNKIIINWRNEGEKEVMIINH